MNNTQELPRKSRNRPYSATVDRNGGTAADFMRRNVLQAYGNTDSHDG